MKMEDMILVSVDDHVVEPPEAFLNHYSDIHKDEAPRIVQMDGTDVWKWNGNIYPTIGLNAVVGRPRSEYGVEPTGFDQLRKGTYDNAARVDDMNVNGILGSMNFPTFPKFAGNDFITAAKTDPDVALRAIRGYNDWHVHEWCSGPGKGRLIPLILLPLWDINLVVEEIKRMSKLGVHAVSFPDNPAITGLPSIHNEYWEPFWKACVDHDILINCHIGTGAQAMHASDETPIDAWITTMPMSISNSAADWMFGAFWKRHPKLRMALSEGGIGWVPYLLERADFTYEHHHEWTFTNFEDERPSDVFKRHIVTCFIDDQFGVKNLEYLNEDMVCYECDYPHSDTVWPNSPEYLWASVNALSDSLINKITHENAMKLLNYNPFELLGGRDKCTVGHLRELGKHVDVRPREGLGGLKPESVSDVNEARRPVTSGQIKDMFALANARAKEAV